MAAIAGLQDFRQTGPPADTGVFQIPCTIMVFQHTFAGTDYYVALRSGVSSWVLVGIDADLLTVIHAARDYVVGIGEGSIVFSLTGTHNLTGTITIASNNVVLEGLGRGTTVLQMTVDATNAMDVTGENIVVRSLTLLGTDSGAASDGIYAHDVTHCFFEHLHIRDFQGAGIEINDNDFDHNNTIAFNIIENDHDGILVTIDCYGPQLVIGNRIIDNDHVGIETHHAHKLLANNFIRRNSMGISMLGTDAIVVGNDIQYNNTGIHVWATCEESMITGNMFARNGWMEVGGFDGGYAIQIDGAASRLTITGNLINHQYTGALGNATGIHITGGIEITISGNTIWENPVNTPNIGDAIYLEDAVDCIIDGNTLTDNGRYGINISNAGCLRIMIGPNKIRGNVTACINDAGTDTMLPEIYIHFADPNTNIGTHPAGEMTQTSDTTLRFSFMIPSRFQELVRANIHLVSAAAGNMRRTITTNWGKRCTTEDYNADSGVIAADVQAILANDMVCLSVAAALDGIAAKDLVGLEFLRDATHGNDTVAGSVYVLGLSLEYV